MKEGSMGHKEEKNKLHTHLKEICALGDPQRMKKRLCELMDDKTLSKDNFLDLAFLVFHNIESWYGNAARVFSASELMEKISSDRKEVIYLTGLSVKQVDKEALSLNEETRKPRCYFCGRSAGDLSLAFRRENGKANECYGQLRLLPVIRESKDMSFTATVCHECYMILQLPLTDSEQ
jgi:hypothetical protein